MRPTDESFYWQHRMLFYLHDDFAALQGVLPLYYRKAEASYQAIP